MSRGILHKKHQITTNISTCYPLTQSHDSRGYNKEQCNRLTTNGGKSNYPREKDKMSVQISKIVLEW